MPTRRRAGIVGRGAGSFRYTRARTAIPGPARGTRGVPTSGKGVTLAGWSTVVGLMDPRHLHLAELLDFRPEEGVIRLHEQRVVILSPAAMGLLRKELVTTFGMDTARRLLMRVGYADGYHDAVSLRDQSKWKDPIDGLRAGATLHTLEGIVHAALTD